MLRSCRDVVRYEKIRLIGLAGVRRQDVQRDAEGCGGVRLRRLLQIPEVSVWNEYIGLAAAHLRPFGFEPLEPGVCRDEQVGAVRLPGSLEPHPDLVHVHWPELLGATCGPEHTVSFLQRLVRGGARIVQTVHNRWPHDPAPWHRSFIDAVDSLTSGVHFFSPEHEELARVSRTRLPSLSIHLMHPRYEGVVPDSGGVGRGDGAVTMGCFGRLRRYKRIPEFARVLVREAGPVLDGVLVAGKPDDPAVDREMRDLARRDPRVAYRPGFRHSAAFSALIRKVDWVALPYEVLWSSGVLVIALQLGKRVLCPRPVGALDYGVPPGGWTLVEPWRDDAAVSAWRNAVGTDAPVFAEGIPTWPVAAARLATFYESVLSAGGTGSYANDPRLGPDGHA